jgi:hypothetical protein
MAICDNDRQICSTTINFNENDSLVASKTLSTPTMETNPQLRINIKEKKPRSSAPIHIPDTQRSPVKHAYSFVDKNHCTQVRKKKQTNEILSFVLLLLFRMS